MTDTPPLSDAARRDVQNELRRVCPNYDFLPVSEQEALIATHVKTRNVTAAPPANNVLPLPPLIDTGMSYNPPLPGPNDDMAKLRAHLAEIIDAHDQALAAWAEAQYLHEQATVRVSEAETALAAFADLDAKITAADVDGLKSGERTELPYALAQALRQRDAARDRLERVTRAQRQVQEQYQAATQRLTTARADREVAAAAVAVAEVWALLFAAETFEHAPRDMRSACASLQLAFDLPAALIARLHAQPPPIKSNPKAKAQWQAYMAALRKNAYAKPTGLWDAIAEPSEPDTPDVATGD